MNPKSIILAFLVLLMLSIFASGSLPLASVAFAANPSANLDQCANDPAPSPSTDGCNTTATQWVNGNLGASKAVYFEGDSIPYRMRFDNLSLASHTVTIEWDTTKSGKHALDYIDNFNQSVLNANPCLGVSGCSAFSTFAIPADPQVTGAGVTPVAGNFRLYGGTITAVSAYSGGAGFPAGDNSRRITITFTASVANPVLAWGGHISTRLDWGPNNSAVAIPGSPYHMRLIDLDGAGGNQDRSLAAAAVIFPGSITIIKDAIPNDPQDFSFSTTGGLSPASFSLDDDSDPTLSNTQLYSGIINFTTYTFTEAAVAQWVLTFGTPPCTVSSPNGGTQSTSGSTLTINLNEGENVTCTFTNTRNKNSPTIATTLSASSITVGGSAHDSATLSGATSNAGGTVTYTAYSDSSCSQNARDAGTVNVTNGVVPDSNSLTFNSAGTFYWQAVYSGDANNNGASSSCTSEQLVVGNTSPSINTTLSATSVSIGTAVHDSSTLSGATSDAGGTVTYTVYTDNGCTQGAQTAGTKTVTNAVVPDSDSVTFNSAGTFYWQAVYSGDANNNGATSTCTSEQLVVGKNQPSNSTAQNLLPNDSFTLSGATSNAGGTVTFNLYNPNDATCSGTPALTQTVNVSGNGTYSTSNTTFLASLEGTWRWLVSYSGDANNNGTTSACGVENFTITNQ